MASLLLLAPSVPPLLLPPPHPLLFSKVINILILCKILIKSCFSVEYIYKVNEIKSQPHSLARLTTVVT